jgi:hypothetical protein
MGAIYYDGDLVDALSAFKDKPKWLIEPYIPAAGVVFLYGKFSIGKSPLVWKIAQSISEGVDFFGIPVQQTGPVLYIEVDEPLSLTVERLRLLNPLPRHMHVVGINPFSILSMTPEDHTRLVDLNASIHPLLVIVNTLRKSHRLDDTQSSAPSLVYGAFRGYFPDATLLIVHHDRKSRTNKEGDIIEDGDEAFSGTQAWINDAQVGLHMFLDGRSGQVKLEMTKTQLSVKAPTMQLKLSTNGVAWEEVGISAVQRAFTSTDPALPLMARYKLVMESLGVSDSTVRKAVGKMVEKSTTAVTH